MGRGTKKLYVEVGISVEVKLRVFKLGPNEGLASDFYRLVRQPRLF